MSLIKLSPAASISTTKSGVIMNSDLGTFRLKGSDLSVFVETMIPKLDGKSSRQDIAKSINGYSEASVLQFLSLLDERGLLEPVADNDSEVPEFGPQERLVKALSSDFLTNLKTAKVLVVGLEPWGITAASELAATGLGTLMLMDDREIAQDDLLALRSWTEADVGRNRAEALQDALVQQYPKCTVELAPLAFDSSGNISLKNTAFDLVITGLNADDHKLLHSVAKLTHKANIPCLNGHLDGNEAWIGPALVPGQSGCWNCFRLRKLGTAQNRSASHEFDTSRMAERPEPRSRAMLAPMAPAAGHLMAMDALRLLGLGQSKPQAGSYRVQDLIDGEVTTHSFIPMPWCDVCGGAQKALEDHPDPMASEVAQTHVLDMVHDAETLRQLMGGWVDERSGVISTLALTPTGHKNTLPRTASANLVGFTEGNLRQASAPMIGSGKSVTSLGAEIGALGEAIERYSASRFRVEDMEYAAFDELSGEALDPGQFALYKDHQYSQKHFPCAPWDPSQKIHWVQGSWIGSGAPVWVPALPTFFNFMAPHKERFCAVSSNGLAAGGDVRDASVRAAYELLERDAFMLNWFAKLPARQLVIDHGLSPDLQLVMDQVAAQGAELEFWVLDDLGTGIPTVVCLGFGDGTRWGGTSLGLSCHADLRVAASKALMEQAHFGPYLTRLMQSNPIPKSPQEVRTLEDHALYYGPPDKRGAFDFMRNTDRGPLLYSQTADLGPAEGVDVYDHLAKGLSNAGIKLAAVDVTSPDVRLSPFRVARALGEQVQPIHFGYHMRPLANARLDKLLAGRPVNPDPHPIA